jgi:hypothetical protein
MRPDKYVMFDVYFPGALGIPLRTPVEMSYDGSIDSYGGIFLDGYGFGMRLIDVYVLADPDIFADAGSPQAMQKGSYREPSRRRVGDSAKKSLKEIRHLGSLRIEMAETGIKQRFSWKKQVRMTGRGNLDFL